MKAVYYTSYGDPDHFEIKEVDIPFAREKEILVEVFVTTVNRSDCAILKGSLLMRLFTGLFRPRLPVPGTDFAGKVILTGKGVTRFKPGDRVFGFYDMGLSSQAEYISIREHKAISIIPDHLKDDQAVALLEGAHYAINMINKVDLKEGQMVLINGATGAIGSALLQLCNYYKAKITVTCEGEHADLVKSLGAQTVIDYRHADFVHTDERFDLIFDAAGKSTFGKCKTILKEGGKYISSDLGPWAQNLFLALFTKFRAGKQVIFPVPFNIQASIDRMVRMAGEGSFAPVIDRKYDLASVREAYKYVASGKKIGNVILKVKD